MTNAPFTAALELLRNRIIVLNASKHNRRRRVLREKWKMTEKNSTLHGISKEIAVALNCLLSTKHVWDQICHTVCWGNISSEEATSLRYLPGNFIHFGCQANRRHTKVMLESWVKTHINGQGASWCVSGISRSLLETEPLTYPEYCSSWRKSRKKGLFLCNSFCSHFRGV